METLKFKTNINCGGCIANVTPTLNNLKGVKHWEVNTADPNKILSIEAEDGLTTVDVINTLKNKGYNAQAV
ncbi:MULTISPECIES: heavy-metal-associated domain-containing protein [unclassified Mucilaginibacter]|jgi:copper chaperone|uniref:heavy-metal-associated domain-containing protein n=1 Tax=unclassified Mucilaginibacter TaxID=2617802 RepID=UPI00327B0E25